MKDIRFIVLNFYSKKDLNGNVYWHAKVISVKTSKFLFVVSGGEKNISWFLLNNGLGYPEVFPVEICLTKKKFREIAESYSTVTYSEHELTFDLILDLEK